MLVGGSVTGLLQAPEQKLNGQAICFPKGLRGLSGHTNDQRPAKRESDEVSVKGLFGPWSTRVGEFEFGAFWGGYLVFVEGALLWIV